MLRTNIISEIVTQINGISSNVHQQIMEGEVEVGGEEGRELYGKDLELFKAQSVRIELEEKVKFMLKEDVITKKDYDFKIKLIHEHFVESEISNSQ